MYVLCPYLAQYNRWDILGVRVGFSESDKIFCSFTFEILYFYLCLSVCRVQITDQELGCTFINQHNCLLIRSLAHLSRHLSSVLLVMNCTQILVRTTHYGVHLNGTHSDNVLDPSERPIPVNVLNLFRASDSHLSEWELLLSPCLCLVGNSQLDYHFFSDVCWTVHHCDNWRIKKPTRCHLLFYCASYRLNMFRALLYLSSGARDYNVGYHVGCFLLGLL